MVTTNRFDVLIIGSGAAGLTLALRLPAHVSVAILAKSSLEEGSTLYAQGGISAVTDPQDTFESHIADTLDAGAGLNQEAAVRFTIEHAPAAIDWLVDLGVPFTRHQDSGTADSFHLTREGGHSTRRVLHAADATGRAMETTLVSEAIKRDNITLLEHHIAIDLITADKLGLPDNRALGAYVLDRAGKHVRAIPARNVVLATGGASKVYLYTSNPDTSSGDGIAMAWRAGCRVANMEFMQFHPTCLYHPDARNFLISEAVRGEG
ncbi:MAG: FAD-binding protein, partial [Gammaproteobacteria bacterium]|nr:FAD-binding protein [Gammaproteobacteria bacterium]